MHYLLFYDVIPDYPARRAQYRAEHLALAQPRRNVANWCWPARWPTSSTAPCCCSPAIRRPPPKRSRPPTRTCAKDW